MAKGKWMARGAALVVAALLVSGCGGGGGGGSGAVTVSAAPSEVLQVDSAVQPAGAEAGVSRTKQYAAGPRVEPARVALPAFVRPKAAQARHDGARWVGDARAIE